MNRKLVSALLAGALVACASPVYSQSLGQWGSAEPLPMNGKAFGAYVDANSSEVGFVTQLRLSFYPNVDFGFQGGLQRVDHSDTDGNTLRLGTDFKIAAARVRSGFPVDLSIGGGLGVDTGDNLSLLSAGPMLVASRGFAAGKAGSIVPYASLGMAYASINTPGLDDTGVQYPFRLGAEFRFAPDLRFVMEFQENYGTHYGNQGAFSLGTTIPF